MTFLYLKLCFLWSTLLNFSVPQFMLIMRAFYLQAIERNEVELFVGRWMDLESVIQSEISQKEKNKYCMLTHIYGI